MEQLIKRTKNIKYVKDICDNVILMHPKISEGCQILNVFSLVLFFFPDQEVQKQLEITDYSL